MRTYSIVILESAVCPILGVPFSEALRLAGLDQERVRNVNGGVTAYEFVELWNSIIEFAGNTFDPVSLGRMMANGPGAPIFLAFTCAPNLQIGLQRFSKYKGLFGPITLLMENRNSGISIEILPEAELDDLPASMTVAFGVFIVEKARSQTARHVIPHRTILPKGVLNARCATDFFGCQPEFNHTTRIEFSEIDKRRAFLSENTEVWQIIQMDLETKLRVRDSQSSFSLIVDNTIRTALYGGHAHAEMVCRQLGLSRSTMQRRLAREGTSYQEVYNRIRFELAERYLSRTLLGITEISRLVGFKDPKSFHRAFKKWFGVTPEHFRNANRTETVRSESAPQHRV